MKCGLHNLVEAVIGHVSSDEELWRGHVIQDQRLDARHVDAHLTVNSGTFDADDHPEVGRKPRRICTHPNRISQTILIYKKKSLA